MANEVKPQAYGFSGEWITLVDLVRFIGGEGGTTKTAKGLKLSKNSGKEGLFAQAYEGQNRITLKLGEGEALQFAFAIIRELLK